MFADQLRRSIEAAARITLPDVAALLWRAYGAGQVTETEAEELQALIEVRSVPPAPVPSARKAVGSRPRTDASMERRRRWAASGRLPPGLASRFTLAEQAVLSLVAAETARRGDCRLAIEHMAALAGVSRSTVKNAVREARKLGLATVEERKVTGFRNLPNVVRIVSPEWAAWLRLMRRPSTGQRGGVKTATGTPTQVPNLGNSGAMAPSQRLPEGSGRPRPKHKAGIRERGGDRRAMQ